MISLVDLAAMLPEAPLVIGAFVLLLWGVFRPDTDAEGEIAGWLAILVIVISGALLLQQPMEMRVLFGGAFIEDDFARFMKLLVLAGSAFCLLMTFDEFRDERTMKFEYPVLILLSTVGMLIMI